MRAGFLLGGRRTSAVEAGAKSCLGSIGIAGEDLAAARAVGEGVSRSADFQCHDRFPAAGKMPGTPGRDAGRCYRHRTLPLAIACPADDAAGKCVEMRGRPDCRPVRYCPKAEAAPASEASGSTRRAPAPYCRSDWLHCSKARVISGLAQERALAVAVVTAKDAKARGTVSIWCRDN